MLQAGDVERFDREQRAATLRPAFAEWLGAISCSVLVLTWADDAIIDPTSSTEIAGAVPGARLVCLPDCGHMPHVEANAAFLAELRRWQA